MGRCNGIKTEMGRGKGHSNNSRRMDHQIQKDMARKARRINGKAEIAAGIGEEEMVSYGHREGLKDGMTTRFRQFAKDPLPIWAVDVRREKPVKPPTRKALEGKLRRTIMRLPDDQLREALELLQSTIEAMDKIGVDSATAV